MDAPPGLPEALMPKKGGDCSRSLDYVELRISASAADEDG